MRQGTDDAEAGWRPHGEAVLCVTGDPVLLDECARVAAVAGVALRTAPTLGEAMKGVDDDVPLLLGADVRDVPPRNRPDMILVGRGNDSGLLWHRAAELGVEHVAELPEAAGWLVEFLGRRLSQGRDGLVVSLVGGCGGAGASTTAVLLAMAANARGESVLLVDGDRLGGGLELCLSNEHTSGLAWPDLAAASGRIHPPQLEAALPRVLGVPYVSWPASAGYAKPVAPEAIAGVLEAGRSAFELVVIDLGRSREGIDDFGWASDRFLLVVPGRIRAAVAATQLLHEIPPVPTGLVVRGRLGEGVDAERLAGAVGCPLAAHLPELRAANAATEEGRLPELSRRRDVRRAAGLILEGLVGSPGRSSPRAGAPMPRHARLPQAAR